MRPILGAAASLGVWWLLAPRAEIEVVVADDGLRMRLANMLLSAGHGVRDSREFRVAENGARVDLFVLGLETAARNCATIRRTAGTRTSSILVCAEKGRAREVQKALEAGANDVLPLPPQPEGVLEKVRSCMTLQGKMTTLKPSIVRERRRSARVSQGASCHLRDPFVSRPLEVSQATVLDIGDGGIRIEYALIDPTAAGYVPHGVHPSHFFYHYSLAGALSRDLNVSISGPGVAGLDVPARVAHVARTGNAEVAGLAFSKKQEGASTRVSSVIRK